ncbi:hypothetical protein CTI14_28235 [Methylobacterium radiotolerans]|nr:hypothetical protein CTI14_28235 [Methylobacterium radiotolerans]
MQLFGNPGDWHSLVSGDYYLGYFARSVDNALVLTLLRYGYVPTLLIMAAVVCAAILAVRRSTRSPAALAVVGQLPSLVVVALITQYSMFLWFCVGLAVTWGARRRDTIHRGRYGIPARSGHVGTAAGPNRSTGAADVRETCRWLL